MAKRRRLGARPLLVASAGMTLMAGCTKKEEIEHTGNLMAPPMVELCVEVQPEGAEVQVDGSPLAEKCTHVDEGREVKVTATAEGYEPGERTVRADQRHEIKLELKLAGAAAAETGSTANGTDAAEAEPAAAKNEK